MLTRSMNGSRIAPGRGKKPRDSGLYLGAKGRACVMIEIDRNDSLLNEADSLSYRHFRQKTGL